MWWRPPVTISLRREKQTPCTRASDSVAIGLEHEADILSLTNVLAPRPRTSGKDHPFSTLTQRSALRYLATFGNRASNAIPALFACLRSPDGEVRAGAAYALTCAGAPRERLAPSLVGDLPTLPAPGEISPLDWPEELDPGCVLYPTMAALGACGRLAETALPWLMNLQQSADPGVAEAARNAAHRIRADATNDSHSLGR